MATLLTVFGIICILLFVLAIAGFPEISLLIGAVALLACLAYIINKLMNIEDQLNQLLQQEESKDAEDQ